MSKLQNALDTIILDETKHLALLTRNISGYLAKQGPNTSNYDKASFINDTIDHMEKFMLKCINLIISHTLYTKQSTRILDWFNKMHIFLTYKAKVMKLELADPTLTDGCFFKLFENAQNINSAIREIEMITLCVKHHTTIIDYSGIAQYLNVLGIYRYVKTIAPTLLDQNLQLNTAIATICLKDLTNILCTALGTANIYPSHFDQVVDEYEKKEEYDQTSYVLGAATIRQIDTSSEAEAVGNNVINTIDTELIGHY